MGPVPETRADPTLPLYEPMDLCSQDRVMAQAMVEGAWDLQVHQGCVHNEYRSLMGRVLQKVPSPHKANFTYLFRAVDALSLTESVGQLLGEQLLSHLPTGKRKVYEKALGSLSDCPVTRTDFLIKAFIKVEKLPLLPQDKEPRMIQARSPKFNAWFAQFTKPVEHDLYALVDEYGLPVVAKGLSLAQRAEALRSKWDLLEDPVAISFDLSRWDAHVSVELLKVAHQYYLRKLPDPEFRMVLQHQLDNKGVTKHGLRYRVKGNVMSGDMTTALGNCLIVVAIIEGFKLKYPDLTVLYLDDGDDHVILCNRSQYERLARKLTKFWTNLGHDLKVEGFTDQFNQIMFCQHKPIHLHGRWEMMPDPAKVLGTALTVVGSDRLQKPKDLAAYLGTVWEMRSQLHSGMPVLGPLFKRLAMENKIRLGYGSRWKVLTGIQILTHLNRGRSVPSRITPEAREQVELMWGITPDEQCSLERLIVRPPRTIVPTWGGNASGRWPTRHYLKLVTPVGTLGKEQPLTLSLDS